MAPGSNVLSRHKRVTGGWHAPSIEIPAAFALRLTVIRKLKAVETLGSIPLLMPAWIRDALEANDRAKIYLTTLQLAWRQATGQAQPAAGWEVRPGLLPPELATTLVEVQTHASLEREALCAPGLPRLLEALADALTVMARPVLYGQPQSSQVSREHDSLRRRVEEWQSRLRDWVRAERITPAELTDLTRGDRSEGDSVHLLVMDLHHQINALAQSLATEVIDGAHVWQIRDDDRRLVRAFMRGIQSTERLRFGHPGLETVATRSGKTLLIQRNREGAAVGGDAKSQR